MISIGNRKILLSETILCPAEESIILQVRLPDEEELWKIKVIFSKGDKKFDNKNKPNPYMNYTTEDDVWILNFVNWENSLGATIILTEFAISTTGQPITMIAEIAKLTNLYRVNLQIMIKEKDNV